MPHKFKISILLSQDLKPLESHLKWKCLSWDSVRHSCLRWSQLEITIKQEAVFCCLHCQANRIFLFQNLRLNGGIFRWLLLVPTSGREALCDQPVARREALFCLPRWNLTVTRVWWVVPAIFVQDLYTLSHNIASQSLQHWCKIKAKEKKKHTCFNRIKTSSITHNNITTYLNWLLCSRILHGNR